MHFLEHLVLAGVAFTLIDSVWLRVIKKLFEVYLGDWILKKPDFLAAGAFYILYLIGLVIFVIDPAIAQKSFSFALGRGALYGVCTYGTYELTNKATLKKWSWQIVGPDMAWGTFLTTAISVIIFLIFK